MTKHGGWEKGSVEDLGKRPCPKSRKTSALRDLHDFGYVQDDSGVAAGIASIENIWFLEYVLAKTLEVWRNINQLRCPAQGLESQLFIC